MALPSPERLTVARELHDGLAQDLVGIGYSLDILLAHESLDVVARQRVRETRLHVDDVLAKVRTELLNLRSPESISLVSQIEGLAQTILGDIPYSLRLEESHISSEITHELLLITTEILRNAVAHSRATHVAIKLYPVNNRTCLEISDNGIGGAQMKDGRFGLKGIIERVEAIQGSISIEDIDGTHIALLV